MYKSLLIHCVRTTKMEIVKLSGLEKVFYSVSFYIKFNIK